MRLLHQRLLLLLTVYSDCAILLAVLLQLEGLVNEAAHVCLREDLFKEGHHKEQLFVVLVSQEGLDRDAVRQVEGKRDD